MTPRRALLLERAVLLAGILLIIIALAAVDWRLGLLVAGVALVMSTIDWSRP